MWIPTSKINWRFPGLRHTCVATAVSLSKDLETITAWEFKNMVKFNESKAQYCTLSNKKCPSEQPGSAKKSLIQAFRTAGKKLAFRARKYFSPSNLLTLYKAQIRPSLEYCSHIWGAAAPTTLSVLDAVQRRAIRLIGDPALTCHLQPLSHRRALGNELADAAAKRATHSSPDEGILTPVTDWLNKIKKTIQQLWQIQWESYDGHLKTIQTNINKWNYPRSLNRRQQSANKPDIVPLDHQQKTMFVIQFSAPAEVNIVSKEEEKWTKYQQLLGQLRRLWPDYAVSLLVMVIGSLGGMRNTLLSALRAMPVCRAAAHILAARMQKAVILGGSKKGVAGCRDNLLIDRCVTQDTVQYKRNLSMAWIDYRKAFDTTSHELIVRWLACLSVDDQIAGCIKQLMPLWKTRFAITSSETRVRTELVSFKRGVFQGDSLSPLLFCISLLPLSIALKNTKGYSCGAPNRRRHQVTHLFYMDDLKLYAFGQRDIQHSLKVVQDYSHAIGMEFGTDKCAMVHLKKGRRGVKGEEDERLVDGSILRQLHAGDTYAYLGVAQSHIQEANIVKECLRRKYLQRLRQIWSSELSGKNKVAATNMLAVPLLLYTFGAIRWTVEELRQLDTKTRKRMNMERSLHPKSSVPRIYLPRHLGGRGLLSLERLHNRVVLATACYVTRSTDPLICLVREHEKVGKGAFLFKAAIRAAEELSLAIDFTRRCQQSITELAPAQLKTRIKAAEVEFLLKLHKDKPMHGIFYKHLEEHGLSQQLTFSFLRSSGLKSETEGFIMACQDGVFNILVYRSRVMGVNVPDARCRACRQAPETLMHLLHSYGIDETPVLPYAPGDIESVVENERCRIYWNYSFPTLELVQANKPDIKTMFVIEFSAPAEVNIVSKEEERRTKYQELLRQLRRLWPDYAVSLLVMVIGFLGGMRNTLFSALRAIPVCRAAAHILAARMQKAVILGSLRLLRAHDTRTQ
nr:unnamed protein product [Callosobruchus chinensis]